jgi:hypothetical protein
MPAAGGQRLEREQERCGYRAREAKSYRRESAGWELRFGFGFEIGKALETRTKGLLIKIGAGLYFWFETCAPGCRNMPCLNPN